MLRSRFRVQMRTCPWNFSAARARNGEWMFFLAIEDSWMTQCWAVCSGHRWKKRPCRPRAFWERPWLRDWQKRLLGAEKCPGERYPKFKRCAKAVSKNEICANLAGESGAFPGRFGAVLCRSERKSRRDLARGIRIAPWGAVMLHNRGSVLTSRSERQVSQPRKNLGSSAESLSSRITSFHATMYIMSCDAEKPRAAKKIPIVVVTF